MLAIQNYCLAESLKQAYELNQKKKNKILGGGVWLKCCDFPIQTAIDLSALGFDQITETKEEFEIGCMVSLRQLELHQGLSRLCSGAVKEALRHIVGTQFRNCATVGGSIAGRFGFSDVITLFLALDAEVELYPTGRMPLSEFVHMQPDERILTKIFVSKNLICAAYLSERNTDTDLPLITCGVALWEKALTVSIGARPAKASVVKITDVDAACLSNREWLYLTIQNVVENLSFGSNRRASKEYRKHVAKVLFLRCCEKIRKEV
ncbi:putative oxidoreductase [uncultured Roseburia sp.]|uniref:FAD binding domain-containing protein n=1 Tax=Brotonthovivens ammoniilytica TaxID=2981725 RepID=A0ABT2TI33_9FIRM|nr:FAD binding domain-containing protein [Brotonthovivens ammoniilytica]MCU6761204.1 FAD binding domain-containing protein [Brotonthovivens ammoniilytica]SCI21841.1 putative oxidoreductase [uncultured Roseburia sp.]